MASSKGNTKANEGTTVFDRPDTVEISPTSIPDAEKQQTEKAIAADKVSAFQGLGWLDRFLAIWILLAMIIGILLGNFVSNTGPALQKGKFAGVSAPIGMLHCPSF